jgi:hypothetical protein
LQWKDRRWIRKRFKPEDILIMSFGVTFYGCEMDAGRLSQQMGMLALLPYGLLFRTRFLGKEFKISGDAIQAIYVDKKLKGKKLYQYALMIAFINPEGSKDIAAFRVPYPKQWMKAIEKIAGIKQAAAVQERT